MTRRPAAQQGFVLLLTLGVLVVLAIAAAYFSERVGRAVELASQSRQGVQAQIDMASTRAEVLYRLGTTSLTEFGLGRGNAVVALDDRPYRGVGETLVSIQDTRGLINLNLIDELRLNLLLGLLGIASEQRGRLMDTLRDYTDSDKLTRINGAEEEEYRARGLQPPTNRDLVSPWQAREVIGWRDAPSLWERSRLVRLTQTGRSMGVNPNTAPLEVLMTLPGVTEDIAKALIAQRQISPLTHDGNITQFTGMPLNLPIGMGVIAIPSDTLRITQTAPGLAWSQELTIRLTPNDSRAPWRTNFYSKVPTAHADVEQIKPLDLPDRAVAPPDRMPAFLLP